MTTLIPHFQPHPSTFIYTCMRSALPQDELEGIVLSPDDTNRLKRITHPTKREEFLGLRWMMQTVGLSPNQLTYNPFGKPLLPHVHISLTHSQAQLGLAVSDHLVGIDLEGLRSQMGRIAHKFVREDERKSISPADLDHFVRVAWGAKECLFKIEGGGGWDYLQNFKIEAYSGGNSGSAIGVINKEMHQRTCTIGYSPAEPDLLVWAIEAI